VPPIDEHEPKTDDVNLPQSNAEFEYVVEEDTPPRVKLPRRQKPQRVPGYVRLFLVAMALAFTSVLVVATMLRPYDDDGQPLKMSTHTQLGMPPCNMVVLTGKPCPACGMTTSFALLAHGDVLASLRANWVGTLFAIFTFALIPWGLISAIRGRLLWLRSAEVTLTITLAVLVGLMMIRWVVIFVT